MTLFSLYPQFLTHSHVSIYTTLGEFFAAAVTRHAGFSGGGGQVPHAGAALPEVVFTVFVGEKEFTAETTGTDLGGGEEIIIDLEEVSLVVVERM